MLEQDAGVSVHVGPRVLDFAGVEQDGRHDLVQLSDQFEELVVRQMLQREFSLAGVAWVSFAEYGVPIARNHLSGSELLFDQLFKTIGGPVVSHGCPDLAKENKNFLVGQAVQRS